jgi:hypothetical protein
LIPVPRKENLFEYWERSSALALAEYLEEAGRLSDLKLMELLLRLGLIGFLGHVLDDLLIKGSFAVLFDFK